jgi:thiamine kinase-like enzyme
MSQPITDAAQVTPEWLTDVLRKRGALTTGQVISVDSDTSTPFGSVVSHLNLRYSGDAPPTAPARLFLKRGGNAQGIENRGKPEVAFYSAVMESGERLPIPQCYDAVYSDETGQFHVLLEDLSDTHVAIPHELPPFEPQCDQLMDTLAHIHAHWWKHPRLGQGLGLLPTEDQLRSQQEWWARLYAGFADMLGDRLPVARRQLYENVLAKWLPVALKRYAGYPAITLCHGDAHVWNFLYPRRAGDTIRLLDWETVYVSASTDDLAYMITLFWYPERRARLERGLLRRYHRRLLEHSITDYSWDDCWQDYRLSTIQQLFQPVFWSTTHLPPFLWWYRLERVILAYEDLHCAELLT